MPDVAGPGAHLVDPFDVSSIRSGILNLINDEKYRSTLIDAGFQNAKRYNPDRIAKMYEDIYINLCNSNC